MFAALFSPVVRVIVGPMEAQQHQITQLLQTESKPTWIERHVEEHARLQQRLASIHKAITSHIESLENAKVTAADDIATLRGDAERARGHLSELQKIVSRDKRFEDLWADLHFDMTALAEVLSQLEND